MVTKIASVDNLANHSIKTLVARNFLEVDQKLGDAI